MSQTKKSVVAFWTPDGGELKEGLFFGALFFFLAPFFFGAPFCFSAGKKERSAAMRTWREQDPKPQKECWVATP